MRTWVVWQYGSQGPIEVGANATGTLVWHPVTTFFRMQKLFVVAESADTTKLFMGVPEIVRLVRNKSYEPLLLEPGDSIRLDVMNTGDVPEKVMVVLVGMARKPS